jgi:hypothetical protein
MSVSPIGQSFAGDYTVEFDWWSNFNGPFPGGGNGSTNLSTFGIGTSGTIAQWAGAVQQSVWFAATGDGGSFADWRAYSSAAQASYPNGSPVYPFATRDSADPYFAGFGANAAPAAQLALFPQQTGTTAVGSAGMEWHRVVIEKSGTTATWHVDGTLMATIDLMTVTLGGGNIFFGHSDVNAASSIDVNDFSLLFTLIDNIRVVAAPSVCYPDCNDDGTLTVADFGCFQTKFVAQDPSADCNEDGYLTVADFGCFQTRFVAGCP